MNFLDVSDQVQVMKLQLSSTIVAASVSYPVKMVDTIVYLFYVSGNYGRPEAAAAMQDLEREGDEPADALPTAEWGDAPARGGRLRFGASGGGQSRVRAGLHVGARAIFLRCCCGCHAALGRVF